MPGPSLELEMRLRDQKVQIGMDKLAASEEKVGNELAKIGKAAKQTDAELGRFAKRTTEINATPLEKYNRQLFVLDQALKRNKISQDTFNRAVAGARTELDRAHGAQSKLVTGGIESFAARWLSVGAAIGLATRAIAEHEVKSTTARNRMREFSDLRIELGQVGGPELQQKAKSLTKYGLTEREATEFTLNAQNLGFVDDVDYFAKNKAAIGDLRKVAEIAGMGPQLLGNEITPRESLAMTFAAANPSRLSPAQMSPVVARFGLSAVQQGTKADEVFSWASVLAQKGPSPETMSEWFGTMQTHMSVSEDPRIKGRGFAGAIEALRDMPEDDRKEFLKNRAEGNALYQIAVASLDEMKQRQQEVRAARLGVGSPGDIVQTTRDRNLANPEISSALQGVAAEENRLQAEERRYGVRDTGTNTARDKLLTALEDHGANAISIFAATQAMNVSQYIAGQSDEKVVAAGMVFGGMFSGDQKKFAQDTAPVLDEINKAAEALKEAAAALKASAGSGSVGRSVSAAALVPGT